MTDSNATSTTEIASTQDVNPVPSPTEDTPDPNFYLKSYHKNNSTRADFIKGWRITLDTYYALEAAVEQLLLT
ncbi:hypothetical protein NX059_007100 [Plenodomus lindquistii]|nr:hypothetical protein NX059_007100 [Plenodomus lindquistii]